MEFPLEAITALGIAGGPVFAFLYWQERRERLASQAEVRELLVQVLAFGTQSVTSVGEVAKAVAEVGEGAKDTTNTLAQLMQIVRSLATAVRAKGRP